jgi:NAD(P)-dependent dehydrogenase (short-subunit alcohol dehydrogenase family)
MNTSIKPEVVVITGAGAGIGRATVREFAKNGAHVGLIARNKPRLDQAAAEVRALGGQAIVCVADVADAGQVEAAAAAVEAAFGPFDVWINDAMATIYSPFEEISPEDYKRATEVTYLGAVYGTMAALKRMKKRDHGVIVQVGSALAYRAIPLQSPYCGAKFAIRGFTDAIRSELLHDRSRVRITMVQMPALNTPQFEWGKNQMPMRPQPVPPIFQPETAAKAIFWAAHHARREVYVCWPSVRAIWANKFIPGLLDLYLAGKGYTGQQDNQPADPARPNNLFHTVGDTDFAAHGRFDTRARRGGIELWATLYREPITMGLICFAALACECLRRRRRGKDSKRNGGAAKLFDGSKR